MGEAVPRLVVFRRLCLSHGSGAVIDSVNVSEALPQRGQIPANDLSAAPSGPIDGMPPMPLRGFLIGEDD
ncbi:hypothetical protein [Streptomyces sp. NPDC093109]|uniref:hypothetical protein n=1 Tax=Streptomyces sp. NPDC093109 TaxID=3154977 RepID=UPI00344EF561